MAIVRTVLGDVSPDDIGVVLPHEHAFMGWQGAEADPLSRYDEGETLDKVVKELTTAKERHGLSCFVDVTTSNNGRNTDFLAEVSRRSGVHVVAASGFYTESMGIPFYWATKSIDVIEDYFTREITEGVVDTDVRCGIIKLASGPAFPAPVPEWGSELAPYALGPTAVEEKGFRAAARVQKKLGVAITTHTDENDWAVCNIGLRQLDILLDEGAEPSKCIIGHADWCSNIRYLAEIMERGANVGLDTFAYPWGPPGDVGRIGLVSALVSMGYASQMVLSHDVVLHELRRPGTEDDPSLEGKNLCKLFEEAVPALRKVGISEETIHQITVENPRRILAF